MTGAPRPALPIGTRVRLRGTANLGTIFAVPYVFRGERRVGVSWDADPKRFASVAVSDVARQPATKAGRPKPGDRVSVVGGPFRGASGRVTGIHDGLRFTVLFEDWHKVGDSLHLMAPVFADDLGSYVVPPSGRPVSVGALMRGSR